MTRTAESKLLDFCALQQKRFDAPAWSTTDAADRDRLALAALLLSGARWYGHSDELHDLCRSLSPKVYDDVPFAVRTLDFDCSRFVNMVRAQVEHEG